MSVYRIWFDGSNLFQKRISTIGGIIQDENGECVYSLSTSLPYLPNVALTEYEALKAMLSFAVEQGLSDLCIYGDNAVVVGQVKKYAKKEMPRANSYRTVFESIRSLLSQIPTWTIEQIPSRENRADRLTKLIA